MSFRLVPIGGLGNRIRSILSYRAAKGPLEVLWCNSDAVHHGFFLDVLEPLEGVRFHYCGEGHAHELKLPNDAMTCDIAPDAPHDWAKAYRELAPVRKLRDQIGLLGLAFGEYVAVHARRTDHEDHARTHGHFTANEELWSWYRHGNRAASLYLATDCPETQAWFRAKAADTPYPLLVNPKPIEHVRGYEKRPGWLDDAVIDLFMCAEARDFAGSWFSSFSETVEAIRCGGVYPGGFSMPKHMPSCDGNRRTR